jgi:phosphatidylglycerol:prolipoprotein diacylglycerol transferase
MYLIAFAVTYVLVRYQIKRDRVNVDQDTVLNLFFWAIIGLLIGARLFAALLFDPTNQYLARPWLIFWPFDENMNFVGLRGMNYYGGLVGAIIAVVVYAKKKKLDLLYWGDMMVAGIPLGYTFGRLGNFINGELYGRVTSAPFGVMFPNARRLSTSQEWVQEVIAEIGLSVPEGQALVNLPRHPTQIYEGFTEGIVLWLVLWFIFRKNRPFKGFIVGAYMIGYGVFRFLIDYLRVPLRGSFLLRLSQEPNPIDLYVTPLNFIHSQLYAFLMVAGGLVFLLYVSRRNSGHEASTSSGSAAQSQKSKSSRRKMKKKLGG